MQDNRSPFTNTAAVSAYGQEAPCKVPGLADLHRMTTLLLAERASDRSRILVVGAGGGLEIRAMAGMRQDWRFEGVDPSPAMLELAREVLLPVKDRVELVEGTVVDASSGPFDGATCLLTLHFLNRAERLHTLLEIRRRLKPGARLVVAHHAPPQGEAELWLTRSAAFAHRADDHQQKAADSGKLMAERLPLLTPAEEEALLYEAGFIDVELFYAALSFRGWVASYGKS